jgi:phospholipase/carboxylesterase
MEEGAFTLPKRAGAPPETSKPDPSLRTPHSQLSQNAPADMQEALLERALALEGVHQAESLVSVPGARAFVLAEALAGGPAEAFQRGREFAHLHPPRDGSLHMTLPPAVAEEVYGKGWGEPHPVSGTPMVYGPRDEEELEVIWRLVQASYRFARGGQ